MSHSDTYVELYGGGSIILELVLFSLRFPIHRYSNSRKLAFIK